MKMWNYPIPTNTESFDIKMPKGAKPEHVLLTRNEYNLYVHVDSYAKKETRTFVHINGGEEIPDNHTYVDSYIIATIPFHLYEIL